MFGIADDVLCSHSRSVPRVSPPPVFGVLEILIGVAPTGGIEGSLGMESVMRLCQYRIVMNSLLHHEAQCILLN